MTTYELQRERLNWEHRGTAPWQSATRPLPTPFVKSPKSVHIPSKLELDLLAALDARMAELEAYTGTQSLDWRTARQEYLDGKTTFHELNTKIFVRIENKMLNAYAK